MPVWVSTLSQSRHGVFSIERSPPAALTATNTGVVALVEQFPWGPSQSLQTPAGLKDLYNMFAPPGMSRTGPGYLALIRKAWPTIKVLRVTAASGTVAASVTLSSSVPATVITVVAKYVGTAGNSLTATVSAADDGNVNHFNLAVTVTGASGTTTDLFHNLNYSGVGANSAPVFTSTLLTGAITFIASGVPVAGTFSFTSGADGSVVAADYVGTAGTGDKGLSKLEADSTIRHVITADPGNTLRAAVNAGIEAHCILQGDRIGYINGNSGQTEAAAVTDSVNYQSDRIVYVDAWAYILDDVTGATQLVPSAPFAASVAAQLPASTSIAWKSPEVTSNMLSGISNLEQDRGSLAGTNTQAGITTLIRMPSGGFAFEAGVLTIAPADQTRKRITRRRVGDYIATSFVNSIQGFVDAPNVPSNQNAIVQALDQFMTTLKNGQFSDPNHTVHVLDYAINNLSAANSATDLANGLFIVPLQVQTSSGMEQIFLSVQFGENVIVVHSN